MLEKSVNAVSLILSGIAFIILGFFMFFSNQKALEMIIAVLGVSIVLYGAILVFKLFFSKNMSKQKITFAIIYGGCDFIIGCLVLFFSSFISHSLAVCFGIYLFLHTIINLIQYLIYLKYNIKGKLRIFLNILFLLFFLIPLLFDLNKNVETVSIIVGIYFILYGITHLTDFLTIVIPKRSTNKIKKQVQIPLPVILNAFIPRKLITLVNKMIETTHDTEKFDYNKKTSKPDIYVLIHLANNGTAAMGHMELAFKGKIYSYGNYDMHSRKFFEAIGDGVVLVADKDKYIDYIVNKKERYIIEFGLTLTDKEIKVAEEQLQKIINTNTIPYYSDLQRYEMGEIENRKFNDMSSEIYKYADGKFYKIIKGKYKKFFVLKTNCAMLAQFVLSSIGKEILCVNGIITPGAYYDYLNDRFKLKNTNVITRKVYIKEKKQD